MSLIFDGWTEGFWSQEQSAYGLPLICRLPSSYVELRPGCDRFPLGQLSGKQASKPLTISNPMKYLWDPYEASHVLNDAITHRASVHGDLLLVA